MAEGRGSPLLGGLRLISLRPRCTTSLPQELSGSHAGAESPASARLDLPDGVRTSAPPSGDPSGRACALAPPPAAPPGSELLRPLRGGHDDSRPAGRGRRSPSALPPPPGTSRPGDTWRLPSINTLSSAPSPAFTWSPGSSQSGFLPQFHPADTTAPGACEALGVGAASLHRSRGSTRPAVWGDSSAQGPAQRWTPSRKTRLLGVPVAGSGALRLGCGESGDPPTFRGRLSSQPAAPPQAAVRTEKGLPRTPRPPLSFLLRAVSLGGSGAGKGEQPTQHNRLLGRRPAGPCNGNCWNHFAARVREAIINPSSGAFSFLRTRSLCGFGYLPSGRGRPCYGPWPGREVYLLQQPLPRVNKGDRAQPWSVAAEVSIS